MFCLGFNAIILTVSASIFVFLLTFILAYRINETQIKVSERVSKFKEKPKSARDILKKNKHSKDAASLKMTNKRVLDIIGNELLLANMIIKPEEFLALWLAIVFVPAGLVILFSNKSVPAITLIALGTMLPPFYIKKQQKKRTAKFESQLSDALMVICNCIRSGLTFQQALETSAEQMEPPISQEFGRVVQEIRYGNTLEKAMGNMVKRVGSADLVLAVSAVNIQRQTGGNLSVILENISTTIRDRQKTKDDIRVLTSTGRISGVVIGSLPLAVGLILLLVTPDYIMIFFKTTMGIAMLIAAAVLEFIGFLVVRKIVTVKY